MATHAEYTVPRTAADVTDEILRVAEEVESGWFSDGPIDWEDFLDRMDGSTLADGTHLDMGGETDSPAIRRIQRHIRNLRKAG